MPTNTAPASQNPAEPGFMASLSSIYGLAPYGTREQYRPVQLTCVPRTRTVTRSSAECPYAIETEGK